MPDRFGKISVHPAGPDTLIIEEAEESIPTPPPHLSKLKKHPSSRRPNSALLWLAAAVALLGLYSALGFIGVPYYLSGTLAEAFNKKTGMVFDPGLISFNPFTFHFATKNAKIVTDADKPLATLQSLSANLAPFSLLRMDLVCNTVTLSDLTLNITREQDGSYNFAKILGPKQDHGSSEIFNFADLPFFFSLNNIAVKNGKILFVDIPTSKTHTIEKIQLDLPSFSNIPFQADEYLRPNFSAMINGSPVEFTGQAHMGDPAGKATSLTCDLHSLDLPTYAEYLPLNLPLLFTSGKADGKIDLLFDPASKQEDKLSIDFHFQLNDTELQTADETFFITAPATEVKGRLKPIAKTIVFSTVSTKEPVFQSVGGSLPLSINSLFKREKRPVANNTTATPPVEAIPSATTPPFTLTIDDLLVKDGAFHYWNDKGAKQPKTSWDGLQISVKGYTSDDTERKKDFGSFSLSGRESGTASSFTWQGDLTSSGNLGGTVNLNNMDLKELLVDIGADQSLGVKGLATLKGQLSLSFPQYSDATIGYKLADASLMVQDFQLMDDKFLVLSAPTLQTTALSTAYKTIDFGNITLQNGLAFLPAGHIPEIFKQFTVGKYLLQNIDFTGQFTLIPAEKGKKKTTYPSVSIKAKDLNKPEKAKDNFSLSAETATGGTIGGKGDVRMSPFSLTINTEFKELAIADVLPVMYDSDLFNSLTGVLAGKGSLSLPTKSFIGDLQLSKTKLHRSGDSSFSWDDTVFQGINYNPEPFHLDIATTTINQPQFSWQINAKDSSPMQQFAAFFQQYLPAIYQEKQTGETSKNALPSVELHEIRFVQGNIALQDNRLKPKWKGDITNFSGNIKGIRSTASAPGSAFSFTGKLHDSPFTLNGELDLFAKEDNGKFRMTLNGFPLKDFHEQLAPLVDINSNSGTFDLQLNCSVKDGQFQDNGFLLFSNVKPASEKSESALALALLTGADDKFKIDFDFSRPGPLGKMIFLKEIVSLFQTKVVKADVSPLLIASGDFSDLIGKELAEFIPGHVTPADGGKEVLDRYAALLATHPNLGLELSAEINREVDTPALKKQLEASEHKRVELENQKRSAAWQQEKAIFDQKIAEQQKKVPAKGKIVENNIPPAVLKDFVPLQPKPVIVDDAMLIELAKKRSQWLSQYLTEQLKIGSERLLISPLKKIPNAQPGQAESGVKITLTTIK